MEYVVRNGRDYLEGRGLTGWTSSHLWALRFPEEQYANECVETLQKNFPNLRVEPYRYIHNEDRSELMIGVHEFLFILDYWFEFFYGEALCEYEVAQ